MAWERSEDRKDAVSALVWKEGLSEIKAGPAYWPTLWGKADGAAPQAVTEPVKKLLFVRL